jgi:hypothetical protein
LLGRFVAVRLVQVDYAMWRLDGRAGVHGRETRRRAMSFLLQRLGVVRVWVMLVVSTAQGVSVFAQAQGGQPWDAVTQLAPGQRVMVEVGGRRRLEGAFVSAVENGIVLRAEDRDIAYSRADIRRVGVRGSSKRLRNTLLGAAAGALGGLLVASAGGGKSERGFVNGVNSLLGLGIGAGVGAMVPADPYRIIYSTENGR